MKVSIIVPVYKAEKSILRCTQSILNQSYKDIELIIVDDGSPDKSGEICDRYKRKKNVVVIHEKNLGVSHARNVGLQRATGDYIMFCDSDDYFENNLIKKVINATLKYDSDITIFGYFSETKNNKFNSSVVMPSEYVTKSEIIRHFTLDNEFGGYPFNKLYKRKILRDASFPENIGILEDTYFLCSALKYAKKIYYLGLPLYYYCYNPNSAVRNIDNLFSDHNTLKYLDSWNRILKDFDFNLKEKDLIYIAMFGMAIDFKWIIVSHHYSINKRMLDNLDYYISKYKMLFYKSKSIPMKRKIKVTIKIMITKLLIAFKG